VVERADVVELGEQVLAPGLGLLAYRYWFAFGSYAAVCIRSFVIPAALECCTRLGRLQSCNAVVAELVELRSKGGLDLLGIRCGELVLEGENPLQGATGSSVRVILSRTPTATPRLRRRSSFTIQRSTFCHSMRMARGNSGDPNRPVGQRSLAHQYGYPLGLIIQDAMHAAGELNALAQGSGKTVDRRPTYQSRIGVTSTRALAWSSSLTSNQSVALACRSGADNLSLMVKITEISRRPYCP